MNVTLLFVPLLFAMLLPEGLELLERFRVFRLITQVDGNRVTYASCVGFLQSLDDLFPHPEWKSERHLVVGRHSEYPVAVARQDHLRLPGLFPLDHDVGAVPAAGEVAFQASPLLVQACVEQPEYLGRVPVYEDGVRREVRPSEGRGDHVGVLPEIVLRPSLLEFRPRLPAGGVHPFAKLSRGVVLIPLLETEGRLGDGAGEILSRDRHRPSITPCDRDRLAYCYFYS